jgi:hypothetical protein
MSRELLTENKQHLKLFDDGVSINKSLPKWRRAEDGLKETEEPSKERNSSINNNYFITQEGNTLRGFAINNNDDVDRNIDAGTRWLSLYQTPEGLSFDEIASAGIKDMTRLIAEKKIKYVMAGYGSFGSTAYTYDYDSSIPFITNGNGNKSNEKQNGSFFGRLISKLFSKKEKEEKFEFDAIKFFSLVKSTSKESAFTYRDRVSSYLKALHNAVDMGQTALQEELLKGLITNKYESLLFSEGYYYVIDEETIVNFIKKCEKGLSLDYIKNFAKPIPQEVVNKISKLNELEIFDNYVVLHYDPEKTAYKETEYERAKRKDPIIFGLIAGSKKLYYVTDWIDEYCDLTLEKFVDTLGIKKEDLHMDGKNVVKEEKAVEENKPKKKRKRVYHKRPNGQKTIRKNKDEK